jgi:hypothetical protein
VELQAARVVLAMMAFWLHWVKFLRLDLDIDAEVGWQIFDPVVGGSHLLVKGTDAHRYVSADGAGLLGRFMARQLFFRMFINEEERQREEILRNPELSV